MKWATFSDPEKYGKCHETSTTEGGFSSKKKIESSFETGSETRTHRPSFSSKMKKESINTKKYKRGGKS